MTKEITTIKNKIERGDGFKKTLKIFGGIHMNMGDGISFLCQHNITIH